MSFYEYERNLELDHTDVGEISIAEIAIVALGDGEYTITFEAEFEAEHQQNWEDRGPDGEAGYGRGERLRMQA